MYKNTGTGKPGGTVERTFKSVINIHDSRLLK